MYGSEIRLWREKERSRVRAVQMDNLRAVQGIRWMDRFPNARIRELCGVKKGIGERIDEGDLRWFSHVERMENDRSVLVGRLRKRWIDTVMDCLKKRGFGCQSNNENGA